MNLFSFSQFEKILASLEEEVQVYPRRCIRNLDKNSSCKKCVEICPADVLRDSLRINKKVSRARPSPDFYLRNEQSGPRRTIKRIAPWRLGKGRPQLGPRYSGSHI